MPINVRYPKRLIEVDLPIKRISAHARREKSIRHGHISTLHIWWARRPLAACRAVICAALWPDPADPLCPQAFRDAAAKIITDFARKAATTGRLMDTCSKDSFSRWETLAKQAKVLDTQDDTHLNILRFALLDFIADFANWDNSTVPEYLETARALTQAAHEALGGEPGTRPLVVDPFAGGGSIPLEALRVGADAFASDLNPVAVLLNKVVLEYIPKYGQKLADEVRKWGLWIKEQAEKELAEFYPKDPDGATPIAYLWARTIKCEGPSCGAEVPLIRSLWLAKKGGRSVALRLMPRPKLKRVDFEIIEKAKTKDVAEGTVRRGSATCPICSFTTPVASVRRQLKERRGGAADARLFCVVTTRPGQLGRFYRIPTQSDMEALDKASKDLSRCKILYKSQFSLVPDEPISLEGTFRIIKMIIYGCQTWGDLFSPRQSLALVTLVRLVNEAGRKLTASHKDGLPEAVQTCLALCLDKVSDLANSCCRWEPIAQCPRQLFARQAIPIVWDFAEGVPVRDSSGSFGIMIERFVHVLHEIGADWSQGTAVVSSATDHPLPDDTVQAVVTDPPYYDAIAYAALSDYFYVWLRRTLSTIHGGLFQEILTSKRNEIIVDMPHESNVNQKNIGFYERELTNAFSEGRRVLRPDGIGVIVFASKTTASWEAILQAVVKADWTITGSWPIDTEMENRIAAQGQARLASSVHLICRSRKREDGRLVDTVGDWRDVLAELPKRIHDWMPRLASEGVVGADAIFACLGPALEIFSRYSRVEKADGTPIPLKDYLEHVWAAISKEALGMIFAGADATGFEPDARLTAMWLWTLSAGVNGNDGDETESEEESESDEESSSKPIKSGGFILEYDAARKIAQGLGAHLEQLTSIVEVKGNKARLLPVSERARHLFGKDEGKAPARKNKKAKQGNLFNELNIGDGEEGGWGEMNVPEQGNTTLDRIHQSMILFAAGRSEALKRFLVEEGVGQDTRFWRLAQALSALYPSGTDEKRWVDGVLARKKGLGF